MKYRFIRIDYSADAELEQMCLSRGLMGREKSLTVTLRPGDFVLVAKYDVASGTGKIRQVGQVRDGGRGLEVVWVSARFDVHPSIPGGRLQWMGKPSFKFNDAVALRYNLQEQCVPLFSVAAARDNLLETATRAARADTPSVPPADPGYIYVIKSPYGYKLGKSKNLKDRTRLFSVKLPFPITVEISGWSPNYSAKERELHRRFASKRLDGEWFDLSDADLALIREDLAAT